MTEGGLEEGGVGGWVGGVGARGGRGWGVGVGGGGVSVIGPQKTFKSLSNQR